MKTNRKPGLKFFSLLLAICLSVSFLPQTVLADSAPLDFTAKTSGSGNSIEIRRVTYDKDFHPDDFEDGIPSEIEIDFVTRVSWKAGAAVSVKDNKGKKYESYLSDRDSDDCDITILNLNEGRTYTITINGIKKRGTAGYRKLTLKVKIPSQGTSSKKVTVKKVTVDDDQNEIDVKFASRVSWKSNARVKSVKDNKGKSYKGYLTDRDSDDCEIYIQNMKRGRTYTIKISGIKAKGASSYETITVKAKVPARPSGPSIKKIEYDEDYDDGRHEYTVSFDFTRDIFYKHDSSYVVIKDANGYSYASRSSYVEWDDDECEVHLSGPLTIGNTYTYKIVNIKTAGADKYTTLEGSFTANYNYCTFR